MRRNNEAAGAKLNINLGVERGVEQLSVFINGEALYFQDGGEGSVAIVSKFHHPGGFAAILRDGRRDCLTRRRDRENKDEQDGGNQRQLRASCAELRHYQVLTTAQTHIP